MRIIELARIANLWYFTKETLRQLEPRENHLNFNLKYWQKIGKIIVLKKGLYLLKDTFEKEPNKDLYLEFLANKLYEPSYLSTEYIMNKYGLLTESVFTLTSVSTKKTKSFNNSLGRFNYYSLSPRLFFGYEIKKFSSSPIFIARKSKAIFDFLYFRFLKKAPINRKSVEELRINWEGVGRKEFEEIKNFAAMAKSQRLVKVIDLIKELYYA